MARERIAPGPGWVRRSDTSSVWDHSSGMRVHMMGMVRLPDGLIVWGNAWPESIAVLSCIDIVGGSRRRGLLLWGRMVALQGGPLIVQRMTVDDAAASLQGVPEHA